MEMTGNRSRGRNIERASRVSVVVPVYYNELNLPLLYSRLSAIAQARSDLEFEYVFVDDGSGDQSFQILQDLVTSDDRIQAIKLSRNFGAFNAVLAGLTYATGDCVVIIAADLQDPPELIPSMVDLWAKGTKVVLATRQERHDPFFSKLFSNVFNWVFRKIVFNDFPSQGFDFVLVDHEIARLLAQCEEKNTNLMALILWMGFKQATICYTREKRQVGKSRWTFAKKFKHLTDSFVGFSYLPIRLASLTGFALAAVGFVYALIVILGKLIWGIVIEGWSSLIVVVLIVSGVQMTMLGVLGEYIWRNLDQTRKRPPFVVEEVVKRVSGEKA
jgi:glycosyltransferase involved in cell wall biosynthesis